MEESQKRELYDNYMNYFNEIGLKRISDWFQKNLEKEEGHISENLKRVGRFIDNFFLEFDVPINRDAETVINPCSGLIMANTLRVPEGNKIPVLADYFAGFKSTKNVQPEITIFEGRSLGLSFITVETKNSNGETEYLFYLKRPLPLGILNEILLVKPSEITYNGLFFYLQNGFDENMIYNIHNLSDNCYCYNGSIFWK